MKLSTTCAVTLLAICIAHAHAESAEVTTNAAAEKESFLSLNISSECIKLSEPFQEPTNVTLKLFITDVLNVDVCIDFFSRVW